MTQFGFISVSIIIPVYNVEPYIARCLQSVMNQIYKGPIECIMVDDCSTDKSVAIIERMISDYKGPIAFKVLHHERNRGQAAARNTGTSVAMGEYIYYLDSDDAMTPDCLECLTLEIAKYQGVEMVIGAYQNIGDSSSSSIKKCCEGDCHIENNAKIRFMYFKEGFGFGSIVVNRLIKRSFIQKNALFFKEGVIHEDDHWSFYAYKELNSLSIIDHCTYLRYIRPGSTMTTMTHQRTAENMLIILGDWVNSFDGFGRSLQVYLGLELFLLKVYPYVPKKKTWLVYKKFLVELIRMRQYKIAFCFAVNRFVKWRYFKLSYLMIPNAHREESNKYAAIDVVGETSKGGLIVG